MGWTGETAEMDWANFIATGCTGIFKPGSEAVNRLETNGNESVRKGDVADTSQRTCNGGKPRKSAAIEEAIVPVRAGTARTRVARATVAMKPITAPRMKGSTAVAVVATPRATLIGSLTDAIRDANGTGDAVAALIALEALSRLLNSK